MIRRLARLTALAGTLLIGGTCGAAAQAVTLDLGGGGSPPPGRSSS
jgi:hypothetical protein